MIRTEAEARTWLEGRVAVSRETWDKLQAFEALLRSQNGVQNLVSAASLESFWLRHVADSAQLLENGPTQPAAWLDLGSGAGFPGLIVALLSGHRLTLVESRRLRVGFLQDAAGLLGLGDRVEIIGAPVERVAPRPFDVISARAFAPLPRLLALAHPFSTEKTRWILPKGRGAQSELEQVADAWQGEFRLVPSITDPDARIIIAEQIRPRVPAPRQRRIA